MNASASEFGDKMGKFFAESASGKENGQPEVPVELRRSIRQFVNDIRRSQLVVLSPQDAVRDCLDNGQPVDCTARFVQASEPASVVLRVFRTADGGLGIQPGAWQQHFRPLAFLAGQFRFAKFESCEIEVELPRPESLGIPPARSSLASSTFVLSCASDDDDEICASSVEWNADGRITATVEINDEAESGFGVVEAEWRDVDGTIRRKPKAIRFQADETGCWIGRTRLSRPTRSRDGIVRLLLRPMTKDDLRLLDGDNTDSVSQVTEFLAVEEYQVGEFHDKNAVICLEAVIEGQGEQAESPHPFDPLDESGEADLRRSRQYFQQEKLGEASMHLGKGWSKTQRQLMMYLNRKGDPRLAEDVVQETAVRMMLKLHETPHADNLRGWCFRVALGELRRLRRWEKARPLGVTGGEFDATAHVPAAETIDSEADHEFCLETITDADLNALPPEDIEVLLRKNYGQTITEIASEMAITVESVRTHSQNAYHKIRVLRGLELLGDRLSPLEKRAIQLCEISKLRKCDIDLKLDMTDKARKSFFRALLPKLNVAIALAALAQKKVISGSDVDLVLNWLIDGVSLGPRGELPRLGRMLHAQIILIDKTIPVTKMEREFIENRLILRLDLSQIQWQFTRLKKKWDGDFEGLVLRVQKIWDDTTSLVPGEFTCWEPQQLSV